MINTKPVEVFQRAFWKRPTRDDQILHAERREKSGPDGVQKWQWFIAVKPSPALTKYLREDNAFNLLPSDESVALNDAPAWFRFDPADTEVLTSPGGKMNLAFSKSGDLLYATDSGDGFRAGAPEISASSRTPSVSIGRLPTTPPPLQQCFRVALALRQVFLFVTASIAVVA